MYISDNNNFAAWQYSQKNNFVFVFPLWYLAPPSLALEVFKSPILLLLQLPHLVYRLFTALKMFPKANTIYVETEISVTIMSTIFFLFSIRDGIQSTGTAIVRTLVQNIPELNISYESTDIAYCLARNSKMNTSN